MCKIKTLSPKQKPGEIDCINPISFSPNHKKNEITNGIHIITENA